MKLRSNWRVHNKQWDKVQIRIRLSKVDVFNLEVDISRNFYMITFLNFTLKNR
jgi:hypothetical protein